VALLLTFFHNCFATILKDNDYIQMWKSKNFWALFTIWFKNYFEDVKYPILELKCSIFLGERFHQIHSERRCSVVMAPPCGRIGEVQAAAQRPDIHKSG